MESALPPDLARKLLHKDLANLVKRVHEGKKLTRAERAMLQNLAGMSSPESGPTHASNYVELAEILGVTRQTLGPLAEAEGRPETGRQRIARGGGVAGIHAAARFERRRDGPRSRRGSRVESPETIGRSGRPRAAGGGPERTLRAAR